LRADDRILIFSSRQRGMTIRKKVIPL